MVKKQGLIGLYSGRKINELAKKKGKITRTQTALNAQKQIIKKYGKVVEGAKYSHKGKGNWIKYSLVNDRKRTGKTTDDIKEWRRKPNQLDFKGIDTKGSKGKSGIATPTKTRRKITVKRTQKPKIGQGYIIFEKQKYSGKGWSIEKFQTGGKAFDTRKEAVDLKNKLQNMSSGFDYKAIKFGSDEYKTLTKVPSTKLAISQLKMGSSPKGRNVKKVIPTNKPALKTVPKKPTPLKGKISLDKLKSNNVLSKRRGKIRPEKGIKVELGKESGYRQNANIVGNTITVTCYKGYKKLYSYKLKISEWESVFRTKDDPYYWMNNLLKSKTPDKFKDVYNSISYYQINAVEKAYRVYLSRLSDKKPHAKLKKEPGTFEYFGKKLSAGKYKSDFANMKNNVMEALKKAYPDTLFLFEARGWYATSITVYWTGKPTKTEIRKLGLGIGKDFMSWGQESRSVYYEKVTAEKFRNMLNAFEKNKPLKTKYKVSYSRRLKDSDLKAPKPVVKMPTTIPKKIPKTVPKKTLKGRPKKAMQPVRSPVLKRGKQKPRIYKGFVVTGNTYPLKNTIKSMGGKWNPDEGGWVVPASSSKQINALKKEKGLKISAIKTEENVFRRLTEAERLDLRKAKYEKKADRWNKSASTKGKESNRLYEESHNLVKDIPFGQPILVGHHSERAHRNRLDKSWNKMGKSFKLGEEAEEKSRKASIISRVAEDLGSVSDLKGRIAKKKQELNRARNKIAKGYNYHQEEKNILADIKSMEERLPREALEKPTYGINMKMLAGNKLKPLVGVTSVAKRYHNKNLSGGNFAIELRKGNVDGELHGYHNPDGIVTNLTFGAIYGGRGATIISKENYKEFTIDKLANILKKAFK